MNQSWKKFLVNANASFENNNQIVFPADGNESLNRIYPVTDLAVLSVSGKDAAKFLQGQMTCNVNDITETLSGFSAFCTPKGRVITTFLLIKIQHKFLLIMPAELMETVKKRLQMYVLRSDVVITDHSDDYCLIGTRFRDTATSNAPLFSTSQPEQGMVTVSLPNNRYLTIAETSKAITYWSDRVGDQQFKPDNSGQWSYLDVISGIPWLNTQTSEEFIPQMLNLDKLGGISFNKGCYTGQEIVARTHYLGKAKREMFLAECIVSTPPEPNAAIINDTGTEEVVGRVLQAQNQKNSCKMLVVLQLSDSNTYNLKLNNPDQNKITLLTL
jgi:folate-binding protein YgfZ